MKNKIKILLGIICLGALFAGVAACKQPSMDEKYFAQGYTVKVTYDPNGGQFLGSTQTHIVDYLKPKAEGVSLLEPTDSSRPSLSGGITLGYSGHFCAGWYQTRELDLNAAGNPQDENGVELEEKDGKYYYDADAPKEELKEGEPLYRYADRWDFATDKVQASDGEKVEMTLYAAWVPFFEFEYYYNDGTAWVPYGTTNFNYQKATESEIKTLYTPQWEDGAMDHEYSYTTTGGATGKFTFPKRADKTFDKAYTDEDCTQEITTSFVHTGSLNLETGRAVNRVQKIYVTFTEGEQFKIETAAQLAKHAKSNGYYQILQDLDFAPVDGEAIAWPTPFESGLFTGKFYGVDGVKTISNVTARHASTVTRGGIFGSVSATAEIKDITFTNATFDFASTGGGGQMSNGNFGLFAGTIDAEATITGVTVSGTFKIGTVSLRNSTQICLIAGGNKTGITNGGVDLIIYGTKNGTKNNYRFTVDPTSVIIDSEENIILTNKTCELENETYTISKQS